MKLNIAAVTVLASILGTPPALAEDNLPGTGNVVATTPIAPFAITGYIEDLHIAPQAGADLPHAGGTLTVNGTTVIIPDNTVIAMPAGQLTMYDIFNLRPRTSASDPGGLANNVSGLALNDPPPFAPLAAFEATITGNIVDDRYIAGLVNISPEFLNVHQGFITRIDYATGDLCVGAATPTPANTPTQPGCLSGETRLKLNDPVGRFGKMRTDQDARFAVDDANSSVRSTTGYPMCVPRVDPATANDPLCPANNRAVESSTGFPLTRFVMDNQSQGPVVLGAAPLVGSTEIPPCPSCDSTQQAPLMVGDSITFNGMLAQDAAGPYISVWQLVDAMGIFTKPCAILGRNPLSDPTGAIAGNGLPNGRCNPLKDMTYIEWEAAEVGTEGTVVDGVLIEGQDRIKVVGFTTDPNSEVEVYAITSNPGAPAVVGSGDASQDGNLRWIATVVPERVPFGRFTLLVQRDVQKRLPSPPTAGVIPIIDDHLGTDFGAPRYFFVHVAGTDTLLAGPQRQHNVSPVPSAVPPLHGTPVPTTADLVNAAGQRVVVANGLMPSQYFHPIPTYVTPETVQLGDPLTPNNFECMDFLVYGQRLATPSFPAGITMARLSPWPGGLPSGPGLTDGAAAPDAVRCASIIPPETEVALVAPPPSPGTAPGTPPGAAPGGNPPIVITVDPPNPGIIFPPAPGSTPVGDPVSIAADPDGSGTGSPGNAVGASATTGAGNGGVTIFQAARTPSLPASQPRFQASADAADHPNPNYHERTVLALTDRNHISAVSISCDAHRAGSAQTGSTQPGNAPPSLPSTVLAACGDSPDRTATPDQPQDGIGFAGPASSAGAEDTEIADFGIFADVDSPVPSHRGRVHGGSLASEVAAVIPVASVASRPLVKPVTIGATGAVFAGWMFRRRRSTAK